MSPQEHMTPNGTERELLLAKGAAHLGRGFCPPCLEARLREGCPPGPSEHSLSQELEPRLRVKGLFVWGWRVPSLRGHSLRSHVFLCPPSDITNQSSPSTAEPRHGLRISWTQLSSKPLGEVRVGLAGEPEAPAL